MVWVKYVADLETPPQDVLQVHIDHDLYYVALWSSTSRRGLVDPAPVLRSHVPKVNRSGECSLTPSIFLVGQPDDVLVVTVVPTETA